MRRAAARAWPAVTAVVTAFFIEFSFDVGFSIVRGTDLNLGYVTFCGLLVLAAGLGCAAIGALFPTAGLRSALALFVVAHGADPLATRTEVASALAMGAASWVLLTPNRVSGWNAGAAVGAALCIGLVLWSYIHGFLGFPAASRWQEPVLDALVFTVVLSCARYWESARTRAPALPAFALVSVGGLALALAGTAFAFERMRPQSTSPIRPVSAPVARLPAVLVIVLDTVRADHLTSYGYDRDTTPNLARFISEHPDVVQYDLAFSPASWTAPAHASLLTGVMPSAHRAHGGSGQNLVDSATESLALVADETVAEALHARGYCTAAVVANANLLRVDGLQRGFETFSQPPPHRPMLLLGQQLRRRFFPDRFAGWIKPYPSAVAINRGVLHSRSECTPRPWFVLANYMDAHSPFLAPSPHAGLFAGDGHPTISLEDAYLTDSEALTALKRDRYDEALHFLDAQLGHLFAELETIAAMERAWIFITSDHGEAFREHGTTSHGSSIYNEQVRIPLIVKPPRGVRLPPTGEPVSLLDVTTTIAAIAGRDGFGAGRDLREPVAPGRGVAIEFTGGFRTNLAEFGASAGDPARAVVRERWKLLERGGRYELYDLANDPNERENLGSELALIVSDLAAELPPDPGRGNGSARTTPPARSLGADEVEDLRALGYLR